MGGLASCLTAQSHHLVRKSDTRQSVLSELDANLSPMWRYTLRDLSPADDPETWASKLAAEGWHLWIPENDGADTVIGGRHVRRYSLRRWTGPGPAPANAWALEAG